MNYEEAVAYIDETPKFTKKNSLDLVPLDFRSAHPRTGCGDGNNGDVVL